MSVNFYQDARRYDLFEGELAAGNSSIFISGKSNDMANRF